MARQDIKRQSDLEPKRIEFAITEIQKLGLDIISVNISRVDFTYMNETIQYYPYSGWHTGKSIKDGRGWKKLEKQLKT